MPTTAPTSIASTPFTVNGITYRPPAKPIAVICIDGCADEYLSTSIAHGRMPNVAKFAATGYRGMARGALPSFTNVNNCAIVSGQPPRITGIPGNFFLDPDTGEEVMMNDADYLRCPTILAAAADAGRKVAMVTAKDKLRKLLSKGMKGIAFSAEFANEASEDENGIDEVEALVGEPTPKIYSADASLFVLRAGVALLESGKADFLYLSLTDYMQHKYPPHAAESLDFYEAMDHEIGRLLAAGAIVVATADHGMNAKTNADGRPNVIFLETELNQQFNVSGEHGFRVICPITDPYVVHHGALGSAVVVHVPQELDVEEVARWINELLGITEVHDRASQIAKIELPENRIGDLFVMCARDYVVGRTPEHHDLSKLAGSLRSHGGRYEEMVPLLVSEPLNDQYLARAMGDPRNFHVFEIACNGVTA